MLLASSSERGSACVETSSIRQKCAAAHKHYDKTSGISETNRYKALCIIKKIVTLFISLMFYIVFLN